MKSGHCSLNHPYFSIDYFNFDCLQAFTFTRTTDTQPRQRLIKRIMIMADEMFAITCEKAAIVKIQTKRQVPATILISHQLALKARQKTLRQFAAARKLKLHRLPLQHLIYPRNFYPIHPERL
jgi:hypothetical protein